jgi:hypothetical protein
VNGMEVYCNFHKNSSRRNVTAVFSAHFHDS